MAGAVGDRFMGQPQRIRGLQDCGRSRITTPCQYVPTWFSTCPFSQPEAGVQATGWTR